MSLTSLHPVDISASQDRLTPRSPSSASLEELQYQPASGENMLSIEGLRAQLNSCFSCGVSWAQQHVTLDCAECGGYALQRPCPLCQGSCGQLWNRDRPVTHAFAKASWVGICSESELAMSIQSFPAMRAPSPPAPTILPVAMSLPSHCSAAARLAHDLCQRLEKLSSQDRPA